MPSNIQTLNELSSIQITNKTIDTIPDYLRKFKEDNSREISSWLHNSDSSSVSEMIIAIGSGTNYKSNGTSQLFESYSSFILGKQGYQNRWQLNYVKDSSVRDDDFILTYFDGNNHFKRFSVESVTGTIKSRSADFRNGNTPNCNADYQIAFGYSDTAPFNDYSLYRHNFRSSHSNNVDFNKENALDLYMWDSTLDASTDVGSRHVVRWDALGNEELINGTRIDGGISLDISTEALKEEERDTLAIKDKGVIYYNNNLNKYRYSVDGGLFNDFGSSSGQSTLESCSLSQCTVFDLDGYGSPTEKPSLGVYMYVDTETKISEISTVIGSASGTSSDLFFSIYQVAYTSINGCTLMKTMSGNTFATRLYSGKFNTVNGYNYTSKHILSEEIKVKGWFCVVLTKEHNSDCPSLMASVNYAESITTSTSHYPMQFIRNDIAMPNEPVNSMWPDVFNIISASNVVVLRKNIVPYIIIA